MSVSGLLSTMNLPELLQWLKFSQKTGVLVFERKNLIKKIYVEEGMVVSASSNDPKEYLGQILIFFGLISEDKLKEAFQAQSQSKKLLGRVLVENYGLAEAQIARALRVKIEETLYDVFLWPEGTFIYTNGASGPIAHDRLNVPLAIDNVIFEGARRADEYREFKKSFPSDDVIFKKEREILDSENIEGDWFIEKIFAAIDGDKAIHRILLETRAPEYRGIEAFAKLFWAKAIAPTGKTMTATAAPLCDEGSLLKQAVTLLRDQELEKAYDLIDAFVLQDPQNQEGQTLFKVIREAYMKQLQAACSAEAVPMIAVDFGVLSEQIFSSLEGFLASRINGHWDIRSLLMVSPVPDLESLRILKRFLDQGLIRFKSET